MRVPILMTIIVLSALAGCESPPPIVNPPPPGLVVRVEKGDQAQAEARARDYCARNGKKATLGSVNRGATDSLLSYSCE